MKKIIKSSDVAMFSSIVRWVPYAVSQAVKAGASDEEQAPRGYHVFELCCDLCGEGTAIALNAPGPEAHTHAKIVAWQINHRRSHLIGVTE